MASSVRPCLECPIEVEQDRLVTSGTDEPQQVDGSYAGGGVVLQRVAVDPFMRQKLGVDDVSDASGDVIHNRKRRHAAGTDAQHLPQQLGATEGEPGGSQELGQPVEVDPLLVEAGHQPQTVLLVL